MYISEIFCSVQGEGFYIGRPSYFIRFAGCNMRCNFCDSAFSQTKNDPDTKYYSQQDIENYFLNDENWKTVKHVVITGGEPMMFKQQLVKMTKFFKDNNKIITIETCGNIAPPEDEIISCDLYSISPKLSNSYPFDKNSKEYKLHLKSNEHLLETLNLFVHYKKCQLKFVYSGQQDIDEIKNVLSELDIDNESVFLMPCGITCEEINKKSIEIVEICKLTGWNLSTRLHVYLWGAKKGV